MSKATNRILTTHAGSLPRSAALQELHIRRSAGEAIDIEAFEAAVAACEQDVIARQVEAGIDIINDGEVGREGFYGYVRHRMTGFSGAWDRPISRDSTLFPDYLDAKLKAAKSRKEVNPLRPATATGPVTYRDPGSVTQACDRLRQALQPHQGRYADAFMTAASPGIVATAMANRFYPSMADYVEAVGEAIAVEYRAIADAGLILQIDAPDLALERHMVFADKPLPEFLEFARLVVATINRAIEGIPRDRIRLHVCWGNYNGPHVCDVALDEIWPEISKANVGNYLISMANPRHEHEVRLFSDGILPDNTRLVAGVIDVTTSYVEHPETVALRIERAVEAVGDPARVMAGTDCGLETVAGYMMVPPDVAWAKLKVLSEGAALASTRLIG
jgi:5-methyltetrahydropteroyltriglutamate--homocysteine methyltransferase